jgi:hypothetical protein
MPRNWKLNKTKPIIKKTINLIAISMYLCNSFSSSLDQELTIKPDKFPKNGINAIKI